MPTCPNGHQSVSDDWCEVCGHRMAGAGAPTGAVPPPPPPPPAYGYPGPGGPAGPGPGGPPPPPPMPGAPGAPGAPGGPGGYDPNATAQAELCPQCRTPREPMAPFCEECRWNFLTNTATSYTPIAPAPGPGMPPAGGPGGPGGLNLPPGFQSPQRPGQPQPPHPHPDPFEYQGSRPSQVNRPAEPLGADPTHHQAPPQRPQVPGAPMAPQAFQPAPPPAGGPGMPPPPAPPQPRADDDWLLPPPSRSEQPAPAPGSAPPPLPPLPGQGGPGPQGPGPQGPGPHGPGPGPQGPPPAPFRQQPPQPQAPQPRPQPASWSAVIGPDRDYFMAMMQRSGPEATGLNLPAYSPEQHIPLQGNQVSIGRRRHSTGESPDIDLSVPPEDPGVSHQHAVLVAQPDGSWAVVDQNSTNGTTINGSPDPIQPYVPVQLGDGDRVHVGAWTTITVRRD